MIGRLLCRLGYHERRLTTGRGGYVRFVSCARPECGMFAIRKGLP